ncbi:MAG: hypothetical protein FD149_993 [Rhodospirillaceae bacterium]|nr:MAG: hypothetical protein FD149_993 [Rhodospirillaceae bacterium]
MPVLKIQTSQTVDESTKAALLAEASRTIITELGKPERYVMVIVEHATAMMFAGETTPAAYLELKGIGLPASHTASLSKVLCHLVTKTLGIPGERIYIEFADVQGRMWGWNGGTF